MNPAEMPTGAAAGGESRAVSYTRSGDGSWGVVRLGRLEVSGRTAVVVLSAGVWLGLAVLQTGSGGIVSIWANALFVGEILLVTTATRTVGIRPLITMVLAGGFVMGLMLIGTHFFEDLVPDVHATIRAIATPLTDETLRILMVVILLWRWRGGRAWTLGATDVLLLGLASGAGFQVVEWAFVRHRFGTFPGPLLFPASEILPDRLWAWTAVWTGLAGGTLGLAFLLRKPRGAMVVLGGSGFLFSLIDHMGINLAVRGKAGLTAAMNDLTLHGHLTPFVFIAALAAALLLDLHVAYRTLPRIPELRPPKAAPGLKGLAESWSFYRDRRALAYMTFRWGRSTSDERPPAEVPDDLVKSLVERHFAGASSA